jgi:hypothetical protein
MAKKKLTIEQVLTALEQAHGLKTNAAELLGVAFTTIERYIAESPKAQEMIKAMRHKRTDMAKLKLDESIMKGESWAVMFTLKNKVDPDSEFVGEANRVDVTSGGGGLKITIEKASSGNEDKDQ